MFTAMISRHHLLIALSGLAIALGVGWAAFELGRGFIADGPEPATGAPTSDHATGAATGPETQAPPSSADAGAASGAARRSASEADRQVGAVSRPGEAESATAEPTAPPPAAQAGATASRAGSDPAAAGPASDHARTTEVPADRDMTAAAPPEPSPAARGEAGAERSETHQSAARPDADESVPPPAEPQADPGEPGSAERAPETGRAADEPRSASARAADTLKRALATLFGGAEDESVPAKSGEAEVAAVPESAPAPAAPDRQSAPAYLEPGAVPTFDIVRIERGGRAVIAGRAAPGAEVEIRSGERTIDRVRADRRGEWVAVPPEPLGAGVQELSLAARVENRPAVESAEVVVLAVPEPPPPERATSATDEAPSPEPARVAAAAPGDEAFAVALPRAGAGDGRILQAPGRISSDGALALSMLDYDDAGRIRLRGEAAAGAALRIYVDNQPAGATVVDAGGKWDTVLENTLTPGDYTLRLDQLDASGRTDARLETPFTRVSHPPVAGDVQVDYVIVQPGNSLWRIARRVLGEGMHYVHIYEANQAQIRDPDLIYPGQVFELPSALEAAG
jgi:nucleoid-associated protein YgaU